MHVLKQFIKLLSSQYTYFLDTRLIGSFETCTHLTSLLGTLTTLRLIITDHFIAFLVGNVMPGKLILQIVISQPSVMLYYLYVSRVCFVL